MSKKSKEKARLERRKHKASKKKATQAQYEAWRDAGVTKKTRRARRQDAKGKASVKVRRSRERIPFPYGLFRHKDGTYRSMPPWAWALRPEATQLARVGKIRAA